MRFAGFAAVLLVALLLAGCVRAGEQRYVVRVLGGAGETVEVPVPVGEDGLIPDFAKGVQLVKGNGVGFHFAETEKGPGLRVTLPPNAGQDVLLSARQPGARPYTLTMAAGDGEHWINTTGPASVTVIFGDTEEPTCREEALEGRLEAAGWHRVPLVVGSRCG